MERSTISEQIEKILRSQSFATKGQLRKLLEVLSKNIDSQTVLSPDLVIRELWPQEVRTKRSADVATEMNRLRHALEAYYESEGKTDPVKIILPNRAAAADGTQEKRWIVARPRDGHLDHAVGDQLLDPQVRSRKRPKKIALIVGLGAALGLLAYISIHALAAHPRPQVGRLDGTILRIMDGQGKELWSKNFPEGFAQNWYYAKGLASRIRFADLEGDGHTSVLFAYSPATPDLRPSTLICYSDRGEEKWRWTPGRELPELNGSPATFVILSLGVFKATENKHRRIVVESQHNPWWPSQIAILDSNGKIISEYWHSGGLSSMILADLDGDGREEIIATGVSEYDHQATLVILDPDRVFGASTEVRPGFQIHGMGVAQERLRLVFPRSDLNRALFQFNMAMDPTVEHGNLRLTVAECITPSPPGCNIWYEFDKNFHLIAAYAGSDEFRSAHERFYQTGKNAHTLSPEEQAAFQKVRCLVGCKSEFVPVGNLVP